MVLNRGAIQQNIAVANQLSKANRLRVAVSQNRNPNEVEITEET